MRPIVIGIAGDALGYSLAGVETRVCATAEDAERVMSEHPDALFLISAATAELLRDRIREWENNEAGPLFVILPPPLE